MPTKRRMHVRTRTALTYLVPVLQLCNMGRSEPSLASYTCIYCNQPACKSMIVPFLGKNCIIYDIIIILKIEDTKNRSGPV